MGYRCDDCGLDLTLTDEQIAHLFKYGNPVPRPPCPANDDGLHRVADEQLRRVSDRNRVAPETAEFNRGRPGAYTFNAPLAEDFEGVAFTVAAVRIGDHAHVHVESGRAVSQPFSIHLYPVSTRGFAGKLILRWYEWLILRDVLAADERFHVAEVENPTPGMARRYAEPRAD